MLPCEQPSTIGKVTKAIRWIFRLPVGSLKPGSYTVRPAVQLLDENEIKELANFTATIEPFHPDPHVLRLQTAKSRSGLTWICDICFPP